LSLYPRRSLSSILLVEDDDFGRETLGHILETVGYCVQLAATQAEAFQRLHRAPPPALIILNLWERTDLGRGAPLLERIPVIVVSAGAPPSRPRAKNIVAHLEKPVAVTDLLAAIHAHLR
jgi:CheY-like chemotaxis protein